MANNYSKQCLAQPQRILMAPKYSQQIPHLQWHI